MNRGHIQKIFFSLFIFGNIIYSSLVFSQQSDSISLKTNNKLIPESFKVSGYVDTYYAYYTDSVGTNNYEKIPVISPKSNQFSLNVIQLTAQYTAENVRAVATLHYGDIPSSAWSPDFNMIQEANAGFRISNKFWLDAGFFKTHIGTEALLPKDNIASSLAVITFYEPWWQSGVKLSYLPNNKLLLCLHVLNGYNTYIDNNKSKSFGLTFSYTLNDKGSLGYYNLLGNESPEYSTRKNMRFLHNLVFNYQFSKKIKANIGFDYITQQNSNILDTLKSASVYSAIITLKYQIKPSFGIYVRGETFSDENGFLTGTLLDANNKITGYVVNGATLGLEYKPKDNAFIRLEGRNLQMDNDQKIFRTDGKDTNNRYEIMVNLGVSF